MLNNRLQLSVLTGAILGVLCIIGSGIRFGYNGNEIFLLALWYNRLIMGVVFGLLDDEQGIKIIIRGAILGFLISFAFYLSTGFKDIIALFAGIGYGVIIDFMASSYIKK